MFNRRRLARERLEYYLVYLILAYRRLILVDRMWKKLPSDHPSVYHTPALES